MSCVRAAPTAVPAMRPAMRNTVMAVGNTSKGSLLEAWTRARWLMRANTGTLQIAASAVAVAVDLFWAALSCHAEA